MRTILPKVQVSPWLGVANRTASACLVADAAGLSWGAWHRLGHCDCCRASLGRALRRVHPPGGYGASIDVAAL